jgi:hypothetical protein
MLTTITSQHQARTPSTRCLLICKNLILLFTLKLAVAPSWLHCKCFLALLQQVLPKSDCTISVVSFLNMCKGEKKEHSTFPMKQPSNAN